MRFPVLPALYYQSHFFEWIEFLEAHCSKLFEPRHKKWIQDFRTLSGEAQCIYIRMVNRKGFVFDKESFQKYQEIEDPLGALEQLERAGFCSIPTSGDEKLLLDFLDKLQLRGWLQVLGVHVRSSASRQQLNEVARIESARLAISELPQTPQLIVQRRWEELEYLLFLFFGRLQKNLTLYALRDLGIRKTGGLKAHFKPRFANLREAWDEFVLARKQEELTDPWTSPDFDALISFCRQQQGLSSAARRSRDTLLLSIAEKAESAVALKALEECRSGLAREKRARLLFKEGRKEECRQVLEEILSAPWTDEELLFAEDFVARKFDQNKIGLLTRTLREAKEVTISDLYFKQPEQGVMDLFRRQGRNSHFTENRLWTGLFGLLFWDELFSGENAALFNPFERAPADLVGCDFFDNHRDQIESKLLDLRDLRATKLRLLRTIAVHFGKTNDVFPWDPELVEVIFGFLDLARDKNLAHVLRQMARQYEFYHSGYPDLMVERQGVATFVEVKAEGDSVRSQQLSKARLLSEAGFDVEVLRVRWKADPDQVYAVVDVETTGGSSAFHRITEIGAVLVRGRQVVGQFQTLINPMRPIPASITRITGITDAMVADAPVFSEIADAFDEFTREAVFVAHNARFDYGFIQQEFRRLGRSFIRTPMCTVSGMRRAYPGLDSYSLKNLTDHFRISLDTHHRALCDARAASELLLLINEKRLE